MRGGKIKFLVARRIALAALVLLLAAAAGLAVRQQEASSARSPYAHVVVPNLTLASPMHPARLDRNSALAIVKAKLRPEMFQHPYTVEYGAFDESGLALVTGGPGSAPQSLGKRDVWKVTITGLSLARPCGPATSTGPHCPPPVSTMVFFVDDRLGQVLEAQGY